LFGLTALGELLLGVVVGGVFLHDLAGLFMVGEFLLGERAGFEYPGPFAYGMILIGVVRV
jgi:hypothetical protein